MIYGYPRLDFKYVDYNWQVDEASLRRKLGKTHMSHDMEIT